MGKRIAVLMTCYNRVQTTLQCLERLFAQMLPAGFVLDVWVVDDASPDETGDKVLSWYASRTSSGIGLHLIRGCGSLFWCKGTRLAWDMAIEWERKNDANYDYYLWLNDDVRLKEDALIGLLSDGELTGGVVVGTFASDAREQDVSYGVASPRGGKCVPTGEPQLADGFMNGNLVLIPRTAYEKVGPMWGGYSHAFGDHDYSLVLKRVGFPVYVSSRYCGVCPQQPERYRHLKGLSLGQRLALLFNPMGFSLHDTFWFRYRHWGLARAFISCCHVVALVILGQERR